MDLLKKKKVIYLENNVETLKGQIFSLYIEKEY